MEPVPTTVKVCDNETYSGTASYVVLIDAHIVEDIGYITDDDADGTFDMFHGENIETELGQEDGKYLIDTNGDGDWNYTYDLIEGLETYNKSEEIEIPWIMIAAIIIATALIAIIVYLYKKEYF